MLKPMQDILLGLAVYLFLANWKWYDTFKWGILMKILILYTMLGLWIWSWVCRISSLWAQVACGPLKYLAPSMNMVSLYLVPIKHEKRVTKQCCKSGELHVTTSQESRDVDVIWQEAGRLPWQLTDDSRPVRKQRPFILLNANEACHTGVENEAGHWMAHIQCNMSIKMPVYNDIKYGLFEAGDSCQGVCNTGSTDQSNLCYRSSV